MKIREEARRRERQRLAAMDRQQEVAAAPDAATTELTARAIREVQGLPEHYRLPVWMHFMEGFSFSEVGCALSLSEDTVREQARRGLKHVREALSAAGFAASAVAIPELLAAAPLAPAPAGLTASFKTIIASAATKTSGVAMGAASTAVKGTVTTTMSQTVITAALVLASAAAIATALQFGGRRIVTKAESDGRTAGVSPAMGAGEAPALRAPGKELAEILNKKIDILYRRDYLSEVLDDLDKRVGLRSAFPKPIDKTFMFSLEEKQITVKQVLEKLAAEGKLDLEYHNDTVVLWKKADDKVLAALEKKLKEGDVEARREAVYGLAQLGDKRIYPLILQGLCDKQDAVVVKAIIELDFHTATLCYGVSASAIFEQSLKLLSTPGMAAYKGNLISLMGSSRDPRAVEILIALSKDTDENLRSRAASALSDTRDPRAIESLIALSKDTDANLRSSAADGLDYTQDPRATEPLITLSKDTNANVRSCAASTLGNSRDPRAIEPLITLSKDTDANVRASAASTLGILRDPRAIEPLIPLLKDTHPVVRNKAASVLESYFSENVQVKTALDDYKKGESERKAEAKPQPVKSPASPSSEDF